MLFTNGNLLIIREHPSDRTHDESVPETSNRLRWLRWLNYVPNVNPKVPTTDIDLTDGWNSGSQLKWQHTCKWQTELGCRRCSNKQNIVEAYTQEQNSVNSENKAVNQHIRKKHEHKQCLLYIVYY